MSQISTEPCIREFPRRRPFPLEPRDPNACPRFSLQMASTRKADNENGSHSHKNAQNPLLQRMAGLEQDRRRQVYLKRVRQTSDDKKWESRSEQVGHNADASRFGEITLIYHQDYEARFPCEAEAMGDGSSTRGIRDPTYAR